MVYMALNGREALEETDTRAKIADEAQVLNELKESASRRIRIVYGVLVAYLSAVTIAALIFG